MLRNVFVVLVTIASVGAGAPAAAPAEATVSNLERVTNVPFAGATHLEFMQRDGRTYALAGARSTTDAGLHIVDVTDPQAPVRTAFVKCANSGNWDIAVFPERNLIVNTTDGNFNGAVNSEPACIIPAPRPAGFQQRVQDIAFTDITDLAAPALLGTPTGFPKIKGIHTIVRHPAQPVAYLSNQETPDRGPVLSILDLTSYDPATRTGARVTEVAMPRVGSGPHDITFSPDGSRAYVSAVTASYILDTTDPLAPVVVAHIVDPAINIHHEAILAPNGRHLFIVDEQTGAIADPQCPGGGVHVYDLGLKDLDGAGTTLEAAPVKVGVFFATDTRTFAEDTIARLQNVDTEIAVCTAHEGNFTPDGSMLTLGWYRAGVRVFDTSSVVDAGLPVGAHVSVTESAYGYTLGEEVWAARTHPAVPGYVFATNQQSGLDVYRSTAA